MVLRSGLLVVEGSHSYAENVIFKASMKLKIGIKYKLIFA